MVKTSRALLCAIALLLAFTSWTPRVNASVHLWHIVEVFSNHDGSVQFIELHTSSGAETVTNGAQLAATANGVTKTYTISGNLTGPTTNKRLLFATPGFAALAGAIAPNYTLPAKPFFDPNAAGSIVITFSAPGFGTFETVSFAASALPKDGVQSLSLTEGGSSSPITNSPTNYAAATGSVSVLPPGAASCGFTGGWLLPGSDPVVITFMRDGRFFLAETDGSGPAGGQNGMERGTYGVDPSTRALTVSLVQDTSGTWGLSQAGPMVASLQGNTLEITDTGESETSSYSRVTSATNPIVGSWYFEEESGSGVMTFLADGRYMFAQDGPPAGAGMSGMERGTYTWNPQTGAFTATTIINTDGEWGLSTGFPAFVFVNGNTMTISDDDVVFARVTAAPGCQSADLDGDGKADVLWRNSSTGENYLYPMNGLAIGAGEGYVRTVVDTSWKIAGTGDFDGDGKADVLWRNTSTGDNYVYLMNGTAIHNEGYVRAVADQNWEVAGVGDFNGDGNDDILWRNTSTGENYVYPMDGLTILSTEGYLRTVASHHWQVAGVGRFDTGPTADILWRNSRTGENYVYLMDGTAITAEGYVRTVAALEWQVAGVGDFTGDGLSDILWRNVSTGENYVYPMNGTTILAGENYVRTVADLNWRIAAVGDYDGNGNADVLWRNASNGDNYVYFMQGTNVANEGYLRNVGEQSWKARHSSPFAIRRGPMDGEQGPSATHSKAIGSATMRMDLFTRETTGVGESNLTNTNNAHIHIGTISQDGAPIVQMNKISDALWVAPAGSFMPAENYNAFLTGGTYVNIHTVTFPGGEIRGQLQ
jgi:hypothetical protein